MKASTSDEMNPQKRQMEDESMARTLAAQAECTWPQEEPLLRRWGLPSTSAVLDAGCGTGEITQRLADVFSEGPVLGVDILQERVEGARARWAHVGERLQFERRSIYELGLPGESFDLVTCRHVVQSIPHVERVVEELRRVLRPGGVLHLLAEDYGMLHFPEGAVDPDELWPWGPLAFGRATGTDMRIGRRAWRLLVEAGFTDVRVDHLVVDTLRAPREHFATIFEAWRDGYAEDLARHSGMTETHVRAIFDQMAATIRDPLGYAVWFVPIISGRR